jgi:hypothetical protein
MSQVEGTVGVANGSAAPSPTAASIEPGTVNEAERTAPASASAREQGSEDGPGASGTGGGVNSGAPSQPPSGDEPQASGCGSAASVAEVKEGARDGRGGAITRVYFKRDVYAIYESGDRVCIQYADDKSMATAQIAGVAKLIPLRDRLNYLILGAHLPDSYREQIAEALRLGLEGQPEIAQSTLEAALGDASERMARRGRIDYLRYAGLIAIIVAAFVTVIAMAFVPATAQAAAGGAAETMNPLKPLLLGTAAGAIGALFSIALGIRARTVTVDTDWQTNAYDGGVRVGIGAVSGAILFLLLTSGIIAEISAGSATLTGAGATWQAAIIIGFAAGFLERLVPDILENSAPADQGGAAGGSNSNTPEN